jgi:hypothetical protein
MEINILTQKPMKWREIRASQVGNSFHGKRMKRISRMFIMWEIFDNSYSDFLGEETV